MGDQLHTDIRAGQGAGLFSVLVTTGVPVDRTAEIVPDRVIDGLSEIPVAARGSGRR